MGFGQSKVAKQHELWKNDLVVLIVGAPGAGKTEFVNKASQNRLLQKGDVLSSRTPGFEMILCTPSNFENRVVLVDSPPYDMEQGEIEGDFVRFEKWLSKTKAKKVNAIIYLHNIKKNRVPRQERPNEMHNFILSICRNWSGAKVAFAATFWDDVKKDIAIADQREAELAALWQQTSSTRHGVFQRYYNTTDSALDILRRVLSES